MRNSLSVKVDEKKVGTLVYENDEYIYDYEDAQRDDYISLTMMVRSKSYVNRKLHPLFEMHLPEGYLLSVIKKHFSKLTRTDDFGLLKLMSPYIKGRVNYESVSDSEQEILTLDELVHPRSTELFDELVNKFALTSSLSGVQPKVLAKVQDKATLATEEYIVKSWGDEYPQLALNEYFCMRMVKAANIDTPEFYISDDHRLFIMKRFDRKEDGSYIGFEDMCVLQAKQRDDKYEGSYESIVKSIKTFVSSVERKRALEQFFKMMVINHFVKNGDGHLKNYGLIYSDLGNIRLAPAYDVVSTVVYIEHDILALNFMGSKKWWEKAFLLKFATEVCGLTAKESLVLYEECLNALGEIILEVEEKAAVENDLEVKQFLSSLLKVFKCYDI